MTARAASISPSPRPTRSPLFVRAIGVLVCFAVLGLAFEGSAINSARSHLRWSDDDTASTSTRRGSRHDDLESVPDWVMQTDDNVTVPPADLLHLSLLQDACLAHKDSGIPWTFGQPGADQESARANIAQLLTRDDPQLVARLRECPDVDVFLPAGLRGHGYCEDAVAYAKYLKTRLLPRWVFDTPFIVDAKRNRTVMYHELCPHTPVIMLNHFWDGLPDAPTWPASKRVYLMPNIEMYELDETYYWRADVVLCKTHVCADRLTKWYKQEGNPRNTTVFYTRHTTSDVAHFARHALGDAAIERKDYMDVKFIHTVGGSAQKGTRQVVDCWLSRPEFPQLDLFINNGTYDFLLGSPDTRDARIRAATNINVTKHNVAPLAFGKTIAEATFFLCTSVMEGYGHYINQARASGGVIVTTNAPPMNELVTLDSGVFVNATRHRDPNTILGGASTNKHGLRDVDGMSAGFTGDAVCEAVEHVLYSMSVRQREAMALRAQQQYHRDTAFFARAMLQLRAFARNGSAHSVLQPMLKR